MALFFIELCVRGTLLCLLVALTLLVLRRAAATYRHLLCTLALVSLLALPLVQELLPPLPLLQAPRPVVSEPIPQPLPSEQGRGEDPPGPSLPQGGGLGAKNEQRAGWVQPGGFDLSFLLPLLWVLGATLLLVRLAVTLVRLRQLAGASPRTVFLETEVWVSEQVTTPLTWGVRHPVILLPAALIAGDPKVAESALRHEKAHIARRDWLWHLLAEVVCALCWFQPGAWWLRRRLRAESERACDDRVLLSGISGPDYAAHLLEILKVGRASSLALGMAAVGSMEARVKHILDPKKSRHSQRLRLALTAALGLALLPLAALKVAAKPGERPVSRLQEAVELLAPKLTFLTPSALLAQANATLSAPKPFAKPEGGEPKRAGRLIMPQPLIPTPVPATPQPPQLALGKVVWGEAVDGLEPGFLLLSSDQVPQNSRVVYQALLRNKSNQPVSFFVRMLRDSGPDLPSFGVRQAEGIGDSLAREPLYEVSLAPGEAVLVPSAHETQELVVGEDGSKDRPQVRKIVPGQYRISQPITLYRGLEKSQLIRLLGSDVPEVKKLSPDGTLRTERSSRASGEKPLPGAQTLEATRMLEVTPALPGAPGPTLPLDRVIWSKAVDGLEPGLLLTSRSRGPLGSKITYQTLVRNTSDKPIPFLTRLLQYDGYEVPTVEGKPTKGAKRTYPLDPLYSVTLAPGESVIVPAQNGRESLEISVGEGGSNDSPSIAAITPGHRKIVQPVTIYRSPENLKLADMMGIYTLSKVSPDGRVRTEPANRATGLGGGTGRIEGGQTLEASCSLEVDTPHAAAERNASESDVELSLRLPKGVTTFARLSQAHFEVVLRNRTKKPLACSWLGYPTVNQFGPELFTKEGEPIPYIHTLAGPYQNEGRELAPGESVVLGTIALPSEVQREWDSLPQGPYLTSDPPPPSPYQARFSLGVTVADKGEQRLTARLPFTVSRPR